MHLEYPHTLRLSPKADRPIVLIADDDKEYLAILCHALDLLNYAHISTLKGQDVLPLAQTHRPDLILLDLVMPDLNGIEVLQRLKQNPEVQQIPTVAVTALTGTKEREQLLQLGCCTCLYKPYSLNDLEEVLKYCFSLIQIAS